MIKFGGDAFHERLFDLVIACWERGKVPAAWRDAVMVPLPKAKGDLRLCDSWRGISLLSVPGKVLSRIIAARLSGFAEAILAESSNGFRPGRGTTDCIALVRALIERACNSDGTLHCVFVDLRKCFDRVHRQGLWLTLERQGVQDSLIEEVLAVGAQEQHPWIVFTAGAMGAGKSRTMTWLSESGIFPLSEVVTIDPDLFKTALPEWDEYVRRDALSAVRE